MAKIKTRLIDVVLDAMGTDRQQIADELKLSRPHVGRVLSGQRNSDATLDKIADVVKTKFKALVEDVSKLDPV